MKTIDEINEALFDLISQCKQSPMTTKAQQIIMGAVAELEQRRSDYIETIKEGMERAREEGRIPGVPPLGKERDDSGMLIDVKEEKEVIREIKLLRLKDFTYREIAKELNSRNIQTKQQKKWWASTIWNIIKRENIYYS